MPLEIDWGSDYDQTQLIRSCMIEVVYTLAMVN